MSISDEEKIEALQGLTKSKGWEILVGLAQEQMTRRQNQILFTPIGDDWSTLQQEFTKGEVGGIRLFIAIPQMTIESLEMELSPTIKDDSDAE